jgi:hypothetical protein
MICIILVPPQTKEAWFPIEHTTLTMYGTVMLMLYYCGQTADCPATGGLYEIQ